MRDRIIDFIEDHRILCIIGAIITLLLIVAFTIRGINLSRGKKQAEMLQNQVAVQEQPVQTLPSLEPEKEEEPKSKYAQSLGLTAEDDGRVEYKEAEKEEPVQEVVEVKKPNYDVVVRIFDKTGVPNKNVDGSSCIDYLNSVSLEDFGTRWGSPLTEDDMYTETRYLVGVEQNREDYQRGDLMSTGWLFNNLHTLNPNDAIKFTNLHVIGSLSSTHTAVLCSYDWYSAFGLQDTLVLFEDISDTLDASSFEDGVVFSATVFVHNIKIVDNINGQRVLCVQYATF